MHSESVITAGVLKGEKAIVKGHVKQHLLAITTNNNTVPPLIPGGTRTPHVDKILRQSPSLTGLAC